VSALSRLSAAHAVARQNVRLLNYTLRYNINMKFKATKIGIFAGAFDPVHSGHIAFALQALEQAGLDEVVFLPERHPRDKPGVEHFGHRTAMIRRVLRPYKHLSMLELPDRHCTVRRTLPQLQALFAGHELVFLVGSEVAVDMPGWPYATRLLSDTGLIVGVRTENESDEVRAAIGTWPQPPQSLVVMRSYAPEVSSEEVRQALRAGTYTKGLLASVRNYSRREWLYVWPEFATLGAP
jgi:nicotinate-nucleotide adenylyltransferase